MSDVERVLEDHKKMTMRELAMAYENIPNPVEEEDWKEIVVERYDDSIIDDIMDIVSGGGVDDESTFDDRLEFLSNTPVEEWEQSEYELAGKVVSLIDEVESEEVENQNKGDWVEFTIQGREMVGKVLDVGEEFVVDGNPVHGSDSGDDPVYLIQIWDRNPGEWGGRTAQPEEDVYRVTAPESYDGSELPEEGQEIVENEENSVMNAVEYNSRLLEEVHEMIMALYAMEGDELDDKVTEILGKFTKHEGPTRPAFVGINPDEWEEDIRNAFEDYPYDDMDGCMEYHVGEEGYDRDKAFAMCQSKMTDALFELDDFRYNVGDFVMWKFGDGESQGEIIEKTNEVGDSMSAGGNEFVVDDADNPLYKIQEWDESSGEEGEFTNNVVKFEKSLSSADRPESAPSSAPQNESMSEELSVEDVDLTAPDSVKSAAQAGIDAKEKYDDLSDCGTGVGEMRAERITNDNLEPEDFLGGENTAIPDYLDSHSEDVNGITQHPSDWDEETWTDGCGPVQYALWGGTATGTGLEWANETERKLQEAKEDEEENEELQDGVDESWDRTLEFSDKSYVELQKLYNALRKHHKVMFAGEDEPDEEVEMPSHDTADYPMLTSKQFYNRLDEIGVDEPSARLVARSLGLVHRKISQAMYSFVEHYENSHAKTEESNDEELSEEVVRVSPQAIQKVDEDEVVELSAQKADEEFFEEVFDE